MKLFLFFAFFIVFINGQIITTIVGNGSYGFSGDNNLAIYSQLYSPQSTFVDNYGNLYICDSQNNRIRKVNNITKIITTIIGNGMTGYNGDNILAINATLYSPYGIFIDLIGNLYISDTSNNRIRFVNASTQIITTIVGTGIIGILDNVLAINSRLSFSQGIFVDLYNNIFIADTQNNRIRFVNNITKIITTIVGNGTYGYNGDNISAINTSLSTPTGIFIDSIGNIYIVDYSNQRIRFVDSLTKIITTIIGNGIGGYNGNNISATSAELYQLSAIFVDLYGNIFITCNNSIRKIENTTKLITTIAGITTAIYGFGSYNGDNILAINATLNNPMGIFADNFGNLYITDTFNNRIRFINNSQIISLISTTEYQSTTSSISTTNTNNIGIILEILIPLIVLIIIIIIIIAIIYYRRRKKLSNISLSKTVIELPKIDDSIIVKASIISEDHE